jgi:hypothetical protein
VINTRPDRDRVEIGSPDTDRMPKRGRSIVVVVAVAVVAAGGGGFGLWHVFRGGADTGTSAAQTRDGHVRFRIPAGWVTSDCRAKSDSCVQAGPPDAPDAVAVMLMLDDPNAPEGNVGLLIFDPVMDSVSNPDGMTRLTINGHKAVRFESDGMRMVEVLLDDDGDVAAGQCSDSAPAAGCDTVLGSLTVVWP